MTRTVLLETSVSCFSNLYLSITAELCHVSILWSFFKWGVYTSCLWKFRFLGPAPYLLSSNFWEQGPRVCIFNDLPEWFLGTLKSGNSWQRTLASGRGKASTSSTWAHKTLHSKWAREAEFLWGMASHVSYPLCTLGITPSFATGDRCCSSAWLRHPWIHVCSASCSTLFQMSLGVALP